MARRFRRRPTLGEQEFQGSMTMRKGRPYDPAWDLWRPQRRWTGVVATAIVSSIFLGVLAFHFTSKPAAKPAVIPHSSQSDLKGAYYPPIAPNSNDIQKITGTKSTSDLSFTTTGKFMIWYLTCECITNFGVIVHGENGSVLDIPVNNVGQTVVSMPANYTQQTLKLNVIADGQWSVSLMDPTHLPTLPTPYEYLSSGNSVLGPFSGSRVQLGTVFLGGIGNRFVMSLADDSVGKPRLLYFESQSFDRPMELTDAPSTFWLIVSGNGLWQIKVKK
jgi:hypothetical protein